MLGLITLEMLIIGDENVVFFGNQYQGVAGNGKTHDEKYKWEKDLVGIFQNIGNSRNQKKDYTEIDYQNKEPENLFGEIR